MNTIAAAAPPPTISHARGVSLDASCPTEGMDQTCVWKMVCVASTALVLI